MLRSSDSEAQIDETLERVRRIETRLVAFMLAQGVEPVTRKPKLVDDMIVLPTLHCSLKEIVLTASKPGRFRIMHLNHCIGVLDIGPEGFKQAAVTVTIEGVALPPVLR